jgi:hypothetical protein
MLEAMLNWEGGEIYVKGVTLYLPLLYNSQLLGIAEELAGGDQGERSPVVQHNGQFFVAAVSLRSLVENYAQLNPESYETKRQSLLKRYELENLSVPISLRDKMMEKLVFEVMPYFVRMNDDPRKRSVPTRTDILNRLVEKANIPLEEYSSKVRIISDSTPLEKAVEQLKNFKQDIVFPPEGTMTMDALNIWYDGALENHILGKEAELRENIMAIREEFLRKELGRQAAMLYLAEKGGFEIDRFGIINNGSSGYTVYVHTGEYALVDSAGQVYLFPDCRIGVVVDSGIVSVAHVLDKYKHPFLRSDGANQRMCILTSGGEKNSSDAKNIIQNLDEGLNAAFYGYSTDRTTHHGFNPLSSSDGDRGEGIRFNDYRIPSNHPRIVSGEVEIKNRSIDRHGSSRHRL